MGVKISKHSVLLIPHNEELPAIIIGVAEGVFVTILKVQHVSSLLVGYHQNSDLLSDFAISQDSITTRV